MGLTLQLAAETSARPSLPGARSFLCCSLLATIQTPAGCLFVSQFCEAAAEALSSAWLMAAVAPAGMASPSSALSPAFDPSCSQSSRRVHLRSKATLSPGPYCLGMQSSFPSPELHRTGPSVAACRSSWHIVSSGLCKSHRQVGAPGFFGPRSSVHRRVMHRWGDVCELQDLRLVYRRGPLPAVRRFGEGWRMTCPPSPGHVLRVRLGLGGGGGGWRRNQ